MNKKTKKEKENKENYEQTFNGKVAIKNELSQLLSDFEIAEQNKKESALVNDNIFGHYYKFLQKQCLSKKN